MKGWTKYETTQRDMWRCVWMKYENPGISQQEIANVLGVPRSKVSRLLSRAEELGMLKMKFEIDPPQLSELEAELKDGYNLYDAIVVPKVDGGDESTRASVGVAAARYFEKTTKENSKITLASGITLSKMVESLTFRKFSNLKLFPLSVTDGSTIVNGFSANSSVAKMKAKYGGDIRAFDFRIAPVLKDLEWQEKLRILEERGIKDHFEEAENADVFLLEISSLKYIRSEAKKYYEYYGVDIEQLKTKAIGEINYLPFDSTHILTEDEFPASKRIISITLERLKKVSKEPSKHVIALASTTKEIDAVKASLFPDVLCYDILIIDEELARGIMKG